MTALFSLLFLLGTNNDLGNIRSELGDGPLMTHTPPRWSVELMVGPYKPQISSDPARTGYYELVYESDKNRDLFVINPVATKLEATYYPFNRFGLVGVYAGLGYWRQTGKARSCNLGGGETCVPGTLITAENSVAGTAQVRLNVLPLTLGATYKADQLKKHFNVPLIPYVRAGFDYYVWWSTTNGNTSTLSQTDASTGEEREERAVGTAFGLHLAGGIALNLDFLEPKSASNARNNDIVDANLFFETRYLWANSFGSDPNRLDLSDLWFALGVGIDFK